MRIGFASQNFFSHFWLIINHGANERATELGSEITIRSAITIEEQIAAINTFVEQRVDALLIGPVAATGLEQAVARARAARIPVIAVATMLRNTATTCTVQSDNRKGAELAAAYVAEQLGFAGEVTHLVGPTMLQDNIDRAEGIRAVLGQHPAIHLVREQESPDWDPASGEAFMRAVLHDHPDVRAVCVANDSLAMGAATAIAAAGRTGDILVTGFDALPEALHAVKEGHLSATVRQLINRLGQVAVDVAHAAVRGDAVPDQVLLDTALVTRDTMLEAALELVSILPSVLNEAIRRGEALARARDEVIAAQQMALRELSTPLIPISDTIMVLPLIGTINAVRAQHILETTLMSVATNATKVVIIDITGVLVVDTHVGSVLIQAAQAVKLLGARVVLTGIRPEVAQTLVGLGIDLGSITTQATLQNGIAYALRR